MWIQCNFCVNPPLWYKHLCSYPHTNYVLYHNWKPIAFEWVFLNQNLFPLGVNNRYFRPKVIYIYIYYFFKQNCLLISDLAALFKILVKSQKHKVFQHLSAGNGFYFCNRFWNARFSDRCHFILLTVFLFEKSHIL